MKVEAILLTGKRVVAKNDFSQQEQTSRWRVVGQSLETDQPLSNAHHLLRLLTSLPRSNLPIACLAPTLQFVVPQKGPCGRPGLVAVQILSTWADPVSVSAQIA
jgi:hypothetical protein